MMPDKSRVGIGDGDRRVWLLPISGWSFLTVYVNGTEVYRGPDYDVLYAAGAQGLDVLVFRTAVTATYPIEIEWVDYTLYVHTTDSLRIGLEVQHD